MALVFCLCVCVCFVRKRRFSGDTKSASIFWDLFFVGSFLPSAKDFFRIKWLFLGLIYIYNSKKRNPELNSRCQLNWAELNRAFYRFNLTFFGFLIKLSTAGFFLGPRQTIVVPFILSPAQSPAHRQEEKIASDLRWPTVPSAFCFILLRLGKQQSERLVAKSTLTSRCGAEWATLRSGHCFC